jgi:Ca2+/Na+ antiporter
MVGKGYYQFPFRPFPEILSINIMFTLIVLPLMTLIVIRTIDHLTNWGKAGVILLVSLLMPIFEKLAEILGLFSHSEDWKHLYTFFGYLLFLTIILVFHEWMKKRIR